MGCGAARTGTDTHRGHWCHRQKYENPGTWISQGWLSARGHLAPPVITALVLDCSLPMLFHSLGVTASNLL